MPVGIGATIVNIVDATTAHAGDVLSSLNSLNANGVSNDGGLIFTSGTGVMTTQGNVIDGVVQNNPTGIVVSGGSSGSGSVTLWQDFIGNIKRVLIYMTSYKSGTVAQTITLPTAFAKGAHLRSGGIGVSGSGGIQLLASSVAQNIFVYTTPAAGGGSIASQTNMFAYSYAEITSAFDTISFNINTSSAHTAFIVVEGQ